MSRLAAGVSCAFSGLFTPFCVIFSQSEADKTLPCVTILHHSQVIIFRTQILTHILFYDYWIIFYIYRIVFGSRCYAFCAHVFMFLLMAEEYVDLNLNSLKNLILLVNVAINDTLQH